MTTGCKQAQAEVVSNSSNKIHQTWLKPFSKALQIVAKYLATLAKVKNSCLAAGDNGR